VTKFHAELDDIKDGRRQPAEKLIKAATMTSIMVAISAWPAQQTGGRTSSAG